MLSTKFRDGKCTENKKKRTEIREIGVYGYTHYVPTKSGFLRLVERSCGHKFVEKVVDLLEEDFVEDCEGRFGGKRRAIEAEGQEACAKAEEVRASKRKQRSPQNKKNYNEDTKFW